MSLVCPIRKNYDIQAAVRPFKLDITLPMKMFNSPLTRRRWAKFCANRRSFWSLWLFLGCFCLTMAAELVANDKPLMVQYRGAIYTPFVNFYPETVFGGEFATETDYRDPYFLDLLKKGDGWAVWAPIRFSFDTINYALTVPVPSSPSGENLLGTDDQGRDVLARLIYGMRLSILFGLNLTILSSLIGIFVGAMQGFFGGLVDLIGQRLMEIWSGMPGLYVLLILSAIFVPSFNSLLLILLLFSWMNLGGLVRAEVLRARNLDYVRAARSLGVNEWVIMVRHVLPNAMVATMTFLPFILTGAIVSLTSLDFLGLGLPPGSPSMGELLSQAKNNLQAPWLGLTAFFSLAVLLSLLTFIGEGARDAFDPRKTVGNAA